MKNGSEQYHPSGKLQGENTGELSDRGTSRGYTGVKVHHDGADTSPDATNRIGGFRGSSDEPHRHMPKPAPKGRV